MASDQETVCAVCLERKHTPLRRDEMGGYVCLTCIERQLDALQAVAAIPPSGEAVRTIYVTADYLGCIYESEDAEGISRLAQDNLKQAVIAAAPPAPVAIDEAVVEGLRGIKDAADSFRDESGDEVAGQVILRVDALLAALNPQPNGGA